MVLLDPNEFSKDGTVALSKCAVSKDAKYLAYALSSSGSDWVTIKIRGVQDNKVHNDTLSWVRSRLIFPEVYCMKLKFQLSEYNLLYYIHDICKCYRLSSRA